VESVAIMPSVSILEDESDSGDAELKEPDKTPTEMSDSDWMHVMYPNTTSRNFSETFCWSPFVTEFVLHLLHPLLTPFVWAYVRLTQGRVAASLFLAYHAWNLALVPPTVAEKDGKVLRTYELKRNFLTIFIWSSFNIVLIMPLLLVVLAFVRSGGTQNYTQEAIFALAFKTVWALTVGVKYGYYSEKLLSIMLTQPVPWEHLSKEQLASNWAPKLDRLMFELRVASFGLPISTADNKIAILVNHPVAMYCLQCQELGDAPLCLIRPSILTKLVDNLPVNNFHRVFWSKPPPAIQSEGKTYTRSVLEGTIES
jgi:hypothetical protein